MKFKLQILFFALVALGLAAASLHAQPGTTVQLPTFGIAVDADGVLEMKAFPDPGRRLHAARVAAAKRGLAADVAAPSRRRYVSLNRLEAAIAAKQKAGKPLDDTMNHLAGLQRVEFVFLLPESGDVVIAGPAEGWVADAAGRPVGLTTGKPVVQLDDLLVALRMFPPSRRDRPFVGCTIDPTPDGLKRLVEFQRKVPRTIPQAARARVAQQLAVGTQEALGMANVRVFGVPADSHFAQVLIEADYQMKLIGIGRTPPPVKMATYISAVTRPSPNGLQRWWFTPNYDCVRLTDDRTAMQLVGQGVQLQSEDKVIGPDGRLLNAAASTDKASDLFTKSFTAKYADIAAVQPVFAQLRNQIDLLVAAAFMQREDLYGQADWRAELLHDGGRLPTAKLPTPKQAPCAANSLWKGNRLVTPAGGGVSIQPHQAFAADNLQPDDGQAAKAHAAAVDAAVDGGWWWD